MTRPRADRGQRRGDYLRFIRFHHLKFNIPAPTQVGYPAVRVPDGRVVKVHRLRAERALGKPLPPGAVVHHADGSLRADAPLVICQDDAYHRLLHARMRLRAAGGDLELDKICAHCKAVKRRTAFRPSKHTGDGLHQTCHACVITTARERYVRSRTVTQPRVW